MSTDTAPADRLLPPTSVVIKSRDFSSEPEYSVDLHPIKPIFDDREPDEWEVRFDGKIVGYVSRYTGSLDRRIPHGGRHLLQPGKRRILWSYRSDYRGRSMNDQVSRADCVRALVGRP